MTPGSRADAAWRSPLTPVSTARPMVRLGPGYGSESGFYSATGRYHLFNTCNTWVARALRAAGRPIMPSLAHTASQLMEQVRTFGVLLQSRAP